MKKPVVTSAIILAIAGLGAAAYFWQNLRWAGLAMLPPPRDIAKVLEQGKGAGGGDSVDLAAFPLKLPPGFAISIFARDLKGARVLPLDPNGGDFATYASGRRNSVFMAVHPLSQHVWATEMGRDHLGDDLPLDEINIIRAYGLQGGAPPAG
jgi:hypothetical protein